MVCIRPLTVATRATPRPAESTRSEPHRRHPGDTGAAILAVLIGLLLSLATPSEARAPADRAGAMDEPAAESDASPRNNRTQAAREMERAREIQMLDADVERYVAPFVSLRGTQEAELVLTSRWAEPFDLSIDAVDWSGRITNFHNLTIEPRQRVVLDLRRALSDAGLRFKRGSIRVEHFGHPEMLQAWIVYTNVHGRAVAPLVGSGSFGDRAGSFWSLGWARQLRDRGAAAAYVLHNRAATPLHVDVATADPDRSGSRSAYDLPPDGTVLFRASRGAGPEQGSVTFQHDGEDGQLAIAGLVLSADAVISPLPVADLDSLENLTTYSSAGTAQWNAGRASFLAVHDARSQGAPQIVTAELLEFETGTVVARHEKELAPGGIAVFDRLPGDLVKASGDERIRLRLEAEEFGLMPHFVAFSPDDATVVDVELLPHSKFHSNGTYPLPSPRKASANIVLLNLGDEPSEIFGHLVTDRGEYALDPFVVPAGGAYDLDFDALIAAGVPDRIGRELHADFESGFFQWSSRGPGFDLLARTHVSEAGSDDLIGFNCYGCCTEFPSGAVYPDESYVFTGESAFFEPQVYVDTCAGMTGPYPANVTSRSFTSPITWSGTALDTTGETEQTVAFSGEGQYMAVTCSMRTRTYFGSGPVGFFTNCQDAHNPGRNGYESCQQQPIAGETCDECCDKQRKVGNCICDKLPLGSAICKAFVGHAYRNCLENCAL